MAMQKGLKFPGQAVVSLPKTENAQFTWLITGPDTLRDSSH
jgi:hypothetical protein